MTIYWYTCRHSDPVDLSDVLQKVYQSLICTNALDEQALEKKRKKQKLIPSFRSM